MGRPPRSFFHWGCLTPGGQLFDSEVERVTLWRRPVLGNIGFQKEMVLFMKWMVETLYINEMGWIRSTCSVHEKGRDSSVSVDHLFQFESPTSNAVIFWWYVDPKEKLGGAAGEALGNDRKAHPGGEALPVFVRIQPFILINALAILKVFLMFILDQKAFIKQ